MSVTSIRLDEKTRSEAENFAKKNGLSLSEYLRIIIEKAIVVEKYHEQNPQPPTTQTNEKLSDEKLPDEKMQAEYDYNLEFATIETSMLLHLIVKDSGKFTAVEAAKLINTSQDKAKRYMKYYKKRVDET